MLLEPALLKGVGAEQGSVVEHLEGAADVWYRANIDPFADEPLSQRLEIALQGIDAQVTFRVLGQGATLSRPGVTQLLFAERIQPLRATVPQGWQVAGCSLAALIILEIKQVGGRTGWQRRLARVMPT